MKRITGFFLLIMLIALASSSAAVQDQNQILRSDSGQNISEKNLTFVNSVGAFGIKGFNLAEMVRFKTPNPEFTVNKIAVLGYDGYNGTEESVPTEGLISLEIRDKDLNLLYKLADSQIPYFNYISNSTLPVWAYFEVPSVTVADEFFVCFYDRGMVNVGAEMGNSTNNSFLLDQKTRTVFSADIKNKENQTVPLNWQIIASGK